MQVDETTLDRVTDRPSRDAADAYAELFPQVYLRFHRRDGKQRGLSPVSRATLLHLTQTGPLTVGECARHLGRAQSVVSEIVAQLEKNGLVARVRDGADARRTLVWLTEDGRARIVAEQEVLSRELLAQALARLSPPEREMLLEGTRALVRATDPAPPHDPGGRRESASDRTDRR